MIRGILTPNPHSFLILLYDPMVKVIGSFLFLLKIKIKRKSINMNYYKNFEDIPAEDLLLLELDPDAARKEWCLSLNLKECEQSFIPLWINRDEIIFLSERLITRHIFDLRSNDYETSEIKTWIEKEFGTNFFLLSIEEAKRIPKDILKSNFFWWLKTPAFPDDEFVYLVDYKGVEWDGKGLCYQKWGVRLACKFKIPFDK